MEADGYRAMKKLLALQPRIDAVFAANDPAAIGAMKAIWEAGLRVPDDIAVVGAGDIALGDLLRVPLTTVSWSREELGRAAAELLLDRIGDEPSDQFRSRRHSATADRPPLERPLGGSVYRLAVVLALLSVPAGFAPASVRRQADQRPPISIASPNGRIAFELDVRSGDRLSYRVTLKGRPVIERSRLGIVVDGTNLGDGAAIGTVRRTQVDERYATRGVHAAATNRNNGAAIAVTHAQSGTHVHGRRPRVRRRSGISICGSRRGRRATHAGRGDRVQSPGRQHGLVSRSRRPL